MGYIIKNTSALVNTRFTDAGRRKLSQGNLNIRYFQVGDSEVFYNKISGYNQSDCYVLQPPYNAQNISQQPQTNKGNVKYPYYVKGSSGNTYGIAIEQSVISPIYNSARLKGFFSGSQYPWSVQITSGYTLSPNYTMNSCNFCSDSSIFFYNNPCTSETYFPKVGDFATIYFKGDDSCGTFSTDFPVFTYRIQDIVGDILFFDRKVPDFQGMNSGLINCCADHRIYIYPSGMTVLYDTKTPLGYVPPTVLNFETICYLGYGDVNVWNMNIPWSVSPAGLISTLNEDYTKFGSVNYLGTKEYLGYQESTGQTFFISNTLSAETTDTYYYNSYSEIIKVKPEDQKAIAIVHYTNNLIDTIYGEKFALEPFDIKATDQTGFARNFKVTLPTLMWHKSNTGLMGETFYVDPNVGTSDFFDVRYMQSSKNMDMNDPGLRYYHLWDTYLNTDGMPSRVGKVFPDLKMVIFDDDEIIAAMSYKANRNWTLPAPKLSLMVPNACDTIDDDYGLLANENEYLYLTYRFNSSAFTNSLHCNYYTKIQGPQTCFTTQRQDVAVKFGGGFNFMKECCFQGYSANEFYILAQVVTGSTTQPNPASWKIINFTDQMSATTSNGYITSNGMTGSTFIVRYNQYTTAATYNLDEYIDLPLPTGEESKLTFGDEYFFYGNIETDIEATIYEMKYLCNLSSQQFTNSSNPTWTSGATSYMTEVGLFDEDKDLLIISKFQSPVLRQGTQQVSINIDF